MNKSKHLTAEETKKLFESMDERFKKPMIERMWDKVHFNEHKRCLGCSFIDCRCKSGHARRLEN